MSSAWIQRKSQRNWVSIAMSGNGSKIVAYTNDSGIRNVYMSTNGGYRE